MSLLSVIRALAWIGVVLAGWSLNLRWGRDPRVGSGPPGQWERHVVGVALLCALAALLLSFAKRRRIPWARAGASAASIAALAIALSLHTDASDAGFDHLVAGPGWPWLVGGAGLTLAAALASWLAAGPARR